MVPRIFLYGDRAWQFGDWEVRLVCRTCKGEKFADDPTGHPRKCATCHGNGVEVKPGKTLADLQRFVASLKAEDMLAS